MKSENTWRLITVLAVTVVSVWLIWPTMHYFLAVSGETGETVTTATLEMSGRTAETSATLAADDKTTALEELRRKSIPLGLDLQGGVDVLLAVDLPKTRMNKLANTADDLRNSFKRESPPIDAVVEIPAGTEEIAVTVNKPEHVRSVDNILTNYRKNDMFPSYKSADLKAGQKLTLIINPDVLTQDVQKTVDSALKVIRERVDKLGVTQPVVVKQGANRIRVQIPGEKDPEQVLRTIIKPAQLEFRGVHVSTQTDPEGKYRDDSDSYIDLKTGKALPGKQIPPGYEARLFKVARTDTRTNEQIVEDRHILVKQKVEMTGEMLKDSWVIVNPASIESPIQVHMEFFPKGAKRFEDITTQYKLKPVAVLLDGVVYTAPNVKQVISEGRCYIEGGGMTQNEAHDLSLILKAGALPAELTAKEKRTVEATLGADSIRSSVKALAIGSIIVAIYMILYYGTAGLIADIAVLINVLLIFAAMKLSNATLTLSGIGGILLTVGMAVDANVLIYERIREELHAGKSLRTAIALGFNRAFSVIFDANLTTLISGLVLLQFGAGSVKGFALTLNIGIIATLFTGLFCTHALVDAWYTQSRKLSIGRFRWFRPGFLLDFVGLRKYSYAWSIGLFLACCLYLLPFKPFHGSNWGVDFEGGLLTEVRVTKPMAAHELQSGHADWKVQKVAGENLFMVRTKFVDDSEAQIPNTQKVVESRLEQIVGKGQFAVLGNEGVSNEVGKEFTFMAVLACVLASIGILIYVGFRFEFAFGCAAVVALFHDLIITYGIFNMLGREVTLDVVAAMLVVLGYSVNDTIIIFDRIRENLKLHGGMPFKELVNRSICESLNRTTMTVSTTVITLSVMLLFGGAGLFDFALILLIGVIKGTYSSSFVASPLLYEMHLYSQRKAEAGQAKQGPKTVRPMMN